MNNNLDKLDSLFQKGYSLYWEGDYKSAFKFFDKSIKKFGPHYLKTFYKGQALFGHGKLTESISYFNESIDQKKNFVEAYITLATVYQKLGNIEKALEVYKDALDREPSIDERMEISENRVKLLGTLKKHKDKIEFMDNFEEGMWYYVHNRLYDAHSYFDDYIKDNPQDHLAYLYSAICHCHCRDFKRGIPNIDKYIEFEPNDAKGWHVKAQLLERMKEYHLAIECCEKAMVLDPKSSHIRDTYSRIYSIERKKVQPKPVKKEVTSPREERLRDKEESPFPPLFGMALVLHTAKKYNDSKGGYDITNLLGKFRIDEYINLEIDYMSMYYAISDQIKLNETIEEIIELSAKLMHFSIKDPVAFDIFNEALGYINKSNYGKGIELLKKAIELSPKNPLYALDLYKAYQKIGNIKKANNIRKKVEQELKHLQSQDYAQKEFMILRQQLETKWASFNSIAEKYKNIVKTEMGVLPLVSILTSEIIDHLKHEENKLKDHGLNNAIDDCLHCFEFLSVVASLVFFQLRFQTGDKDLKLKIKQSISEILGWEPELLPPIQTPNFLSPRLRKKAWLTTLGMDVLSGRMMNSIQEAKYVHMDGDLRNDNPETHVWYAKDIADQMGIGRQHAIHDTAEREKIGKYIEAQFGEPLTIIHDKGDQIVHIDIYVYPPTKERPFGMMITSGMSERPMNAPHDAWKVWPVDITKVPEEMREALNCKYAELIVKLPPDWPLPKPGGQLKNDEYLWPIEELHHLIKYVHRENQWFWDGHTMRSRDDGSLTFAPNTKLAGWVFIYPPHLPPSFGMLKMSNSKVICFLQIVPAYSEEIQYAMQYSTRKLIEKFNEANIPDFIDINRKNTCL